MKYIDKRWSLVRALAWAQIFTDRITYHEFNRHVIKLRKIFLRDGCKVLAFGAGGGCRLCRVCGYLKGEFCRKPTHSLSSLESWGINVYGILKRKRVPFEPQPRNYMVRVGLLALNRRPKIDFRFENKIEDLPYNERLMSMIKEYEVEAYEKLHNTYELTSRRLKLKDVLYDCDLRDCTYCNYYDLCSRMMIPKETLIENAISKNLDVYITHNDIYEVAKRVANAYARRGYFLVLPVTIKPKLYSGKNTKFITLCSSLIYLKKFINKFKRENIFLIAYE